MDEYGLLSVSETNVIERLWVSYLYYAILFGVDIVSHFC